MTVRPFLGGASINVAIDATTRQGNDPRDVRTVNKDRHAIPSINVACRPCKRE